MTLSFGSVIFYLYICNIKFKEMDLNYQLGLYVGEYIIAVHLPTLSTDMIKTRTIINVSAEETEKWEELEKSLEVYYFSNKKMEEEREEYLRKFYTNRKWYHKLEEKYLPETIKLSIPKVSPTDMGEFTKGIVNALWDCDKSHYIIKDGFFEQTDEYAWCSNVTLTRHIEKIPEKFA